MRQGFPKITRTWHDRSLLFSRVCCWQCNQRGDETHYLVLSSELIESFTLNFVITHFIFIFVPFTSASLSIFTRSPSFLLANREPALFFWRFSFATYFFHFDKFLLKNFSAYANLGTRTLVIVHISEMCICFTREMV